MSKSNRIKVKSFIILLGIIFILILICAYLFHHKKEQPLGEYIFCKDAYIMLDAFELSNAYEQSHCVSDYLTYGELIDYFDKDDHVKSIIYSLDYHHKYSEHFYILKEDWYTFIDMLIPQFKLENNIKKITLTPYGFGKQIKNSKNEYLNDNKLISEIGEYTFLSEEFLKYRFHTIIAYEKNGILLTVRNILNDEYVIKNAWIMDMQNENIIIFCNHYEVAIPTEKEQMLINEEVADLFISHGIVTECVIKNKKIHGKLLSVTDNEISLENLGSFPVSEDFRIYRLYDTLELITMNDLKIGYDFCDFIIENGKIEACLMAKDEAMKNVRILIKNTNYDTRYHDLISLTSDTDYIVTYGDYENKQQKNFKAGEVLELTLDSDLFLENRVFINSKALTGKFKVSSINRSYGVPEYSGTLEIFKTDNGLVLINELLLEEYLYSVVPSEMPSSYPMEALKAQAICARTYAYQKMTHPGLPEYGAHMDDSTYFQVYNNNKTNINSTKAVKDTIGQLLYCGENLAETFYYSTSCGVSTTPVIWKNDISNLGYLKSKFISKHGLNKDFELSELETNQGFDSFIHSSSETDYEYTNPWYRWSYNSDIIDVNHMYEIMSYRQKKSKNQILTKNKKGDFVDKEIKKFQHIYDITEKERGPGGVLNKILIVTNKGSYLIIGEYNIRSVLCNTVTKVNRQDQSLVQCPNLLPSAFFVINLKTDSDKLIGYCLDGGGFGHGVGMSQNGAKYMAESGLKANDILTFFYESSRIELIY